MFSPFTVFSNLIYYVYILERVLWLINVMQQLFHLHNTNENYSFLY